MLIKESVIQFVYGKCEWVLHKKSPNYFDQYDPIIATTQKTKHMQFRYNRKMEITTQPRSTQRAQTSTKPLIITLIPRRNRRQFADEIFKYIFLNENVLISIEISIMFVLKEGSN